MGTWTYDYDVYGQLRTQTNALGQSATFSYDEAGRLISRAELEGTATFSYYTVGTGALGKLHTRTAATGQSVFYQYSSTNGNPTLERTTISGTAYDFNMSYDSEGRLDVLSYPNIAPARLRVNYDYDSWGNVVVAKNHDAPTTVYYSLQEADAFGRDVNVLLGNGLTEYRDFDRASGLLNSIQTGPGLSATIQNLSFTWDETGNLETRTNGLISKQETFVYDALSRLRSATVTGATPVTIDYSPAGRITSKSDAGGTFTYGSAQHPNAVTNAAGQTYTYNANGQMTIHGSDPLTWYSFGQPEVLKAGSQFTKFFYDANHQRYSQNRTFGSTNNTIRYVGSLFETGALFEQESATGASTFYRHYIEVRGKRVAVVRRQSSTDTVQYLQRDHQDSIVEVTSSSGALVQSLAYDAWGLRRDPTNWAPLAAPFGGTQPMKRGYTDHEHLDNVELINMNARVQDPKIGMFISADPFVQAPYHAPSLNRYSYAWNNPMTLSDPSGFATCENGRDDHGTGGYLCGDICLFYFSCEGLEFKDQLWMAEEFGFEQQRPAFIFDPPTRQASQQITLPAKPRLDAADVQVIKAWSDDRLSDGTNLNLQKKAEETGFWVSGNATGRINANKVCVRCSDGLHPGLSWDYPSVPAGAYFGHAHTKKQGTLPGPNDNSGVATFGRSYTVTPQGVYRVTGTPGAYSAKQIAGDPLSERQLRRLEKTVDRWNRGGFGCQTVALAMCQ